MMQASPNSKVHGANSGPTWVLSAPDGPHVGPMNLVIREGMSGLVDLGYSFQKNMFKLNVENVIYIM